MLKRRYLTKLQEQRLYDTLSSLKFDHDKTCNCFILDSKRKCHCGADFRAKLIDKLIEDYRLIAKKELDRSLKRSARYIKKNISHLTVKRSAFFDLILRKKND